MPVNEREAVERCLRPFNCVPVWCDQVKFGEMYNGFCKGVLWPIFHNVTSVYSNQAEGAGDEVDPLEISKHAMSDYLDPDQVLEYCLDDAAFPIHGDSVAAATDEHGHVASVALVTNMTQTKRKIEKQAAMIRCLKSCLLLTQTTMAMTNTATSKTKEVDDDKMMRDERT